MAGGMGHNLAETSLNDMGSRFQEGACLDPRWGEGSDAENILGCGRVGLTLRTIFQTVVIGFLRAERVNRRRETEREIESWKSVARRLIRLFLNQFS